ncbi:MAG: cytochrome C oxidase subunit IV family protein [Planctomycetia bacterium]
MSDHDPHSSASHGPITRVGDIPEHGHDDHGGHGGHDAGHGGVGKYVLVFLALCGLTTMSFLTYSSLWPWRDQPQVGWTFMMAVSCTKAMLVILFFMHVFWEANWKYVLTIPAAMMAIFLALMLVPDVGMRNRMVSQERALYMARESDVRLLERAAESQAQTEAAGH